MLYLIWMSRAIGFSLLNFIFTNVLALLIIVFGFGCIELAACDLNLIFPLLAIFISLIVPTYFILKGRISTKEWLIIYLVGLLPTMISSLY